MPIVLGLGALYILNSPLFLKYLDDHKTIVLWEPLEDVYKDPLFIQKIKEFLDTVKKNKDQNILIIYGQSFTNDELSQIKSIANTKYHGKIKFYTFPSYERIFKDIVQSIVSNTTDALRETKVNTNTINYFQRIWTNNYCKNLYLIKSKDSNRVQWFQKWEGKEGNKAIFFIGASPKLEREISLIKKFRNEIQIFTSDTALGYLLDNQILPDCILSFDSGRGTVFHFLKNLPEEIPIFTWLGGSTYLFELPNPKYLVNTFHPLDQMLEALFLKESKLWPSFQNPSLNLVGMTKSILPKDTTLWLSGVDFLSESGKSHCKSTGYETYFLPQVHRKLNLQMYVRKLYGTERKGKNQIAWEKLQTMDPKSKFWEDWNVSDEGLTDKSILPNQKYDSKEDQNREQNQRNGKILSFSGYPEDLSPFWNWALQDPESVVSKTTIKRWFRSI